LCPFEQPRPKGEKRPADVIGNAVHDRRHWFGVATISKQPHDNRADERQRERWRISVQREA
jgi:hypothetical protein